MIVNSNNSWYLAVLFAVILLFLFICINNYFFIDNPNGENTLGLLTSEEPTNK